MQSVNAKSGALHLLKSIRRIRAIYRASILLGIACYASLMAPDPVHAQMHSTARQSPLQLRSSDIRLVNAFNWAKHQAMVYVNNGDPVGPWYEAALPGRRAFCMRDVSHQAAGAQALGLSLYTHNMLRRFAENISASRDWCSYWEIDYLNRPAPVDYKNDEEFWYNLPANFDVLDACYRMYLWTGDRSYIDDPVFLNFYRHTVTDYVARWDIDVEHVMMRQSPPQKSQYFHGDPSYEESRRDLALGVDLLATQYAGYRSFAAIEAIRGDYDAAKQYSAVAADVKSLINTKWWNSSGNYFYAFLDNRHKFQGRAGADLLYRDAIDAGPKTQSALNNLLKRMRTEPESEVESESHYAEILYRYGQPDAAYAEILDLSRDGRTRREYPEVSYSVIGAIVNGLMGVNVEPAFSIQDMAAGRRFETVVKTLPQLSAPTGWAELRNLPIADGSIDIRHEGNRATVFTNHGDKALEWQASFPGAFTKLLVNGKPQPAHSRRFFSGRVITWTRVRVRAGGHAQVKVPIGQ